MKHFRLFTKALAMLVLLFGITGLATAAYSAWMLDEHLTDEYESQGTAIANIIASSSVEILLFRDAATIQAMIEQLLEEGEIRGIDYIFVVDAHGTILAHTFHPGIPDEVRQLKGSRHDSTIQNVSFKGREYIDISAPILGSEVGHVHVGMDRDLIRVAVRTAVTKQVLLMGLLFAGSVVAAYFLTRRLARPLRRLTDYANHAAASDGTVPTAGDELQTIARAGDEVGQLAQAFQHMLREVSSREQRLQRAGEELKALNETLEQRVAERSAAAEQRASELAQANEQLEREVRERKATEAKLIQERYLLDTLMDNVPDSIYFKDRQSGFLRINKALARRFNIEAPEEAVGKTDFDFFTEEHARPAFEDEQALIANGTPLVGKEEKETWANGQERWVLTTKMPLCDSAGNIIGTFGISRDITRRKEAQLALEASERRYKQLIDASLDAIVVANQEQRIQLINPAAERTFGYRADEIIGQPLSVLIPPEFHEAHRRGVERYLATRQSRIVGRSVELRGRRKDGSEFPLELSLSAVDLGGEVQFLGAVRDLTERNRLRAMMVQTEKLASIGQLSAGVAHEINNPLAYVGNNLVVLERDVKGLMALVDVYEQARDRLAEVDAQSAERARAIAEETDLPYVRANLDRLLSRTRDGVHRVTRIVDSMRSLARTAPPDFQDTQVPELIEMSLEMIRGQLQRRNIQVETDYGRCPKVRCVPTQISQVVLNLLVNAEQAVEAAARSKGRVRVATRCLDDEFTIEVADNGCGIEPENLPRLFDPFFTTKPVGQGTGLGLSIAHGIISGHGGRIEVDSRPGEGSTFRIVLPMHAKM